MAPKGTKRAQAKAVERTPKRARLSPEQEMLQRVVIAIQGAEQLPASCRDLLVAAAEGSLGIVKDSRHPCQDKVIAMIGEALTDMRDTRSAAIADEAEKVRAAEASMASLQAAAEAAEFFLTSKSEATKAAEDGVAQAKASLAEAVAACKAAEKASRAAEASQSAREQESTAFDAAVKEHFSVLVDGTWEQDAEAQRQMDILGPFIAQLQLDESLRTSLPAACVKKASVRGSFDCLVLQQAQKAFSDKAAELQAAAAAAAPAAAEAAQAAEGAKQAVEAAKAEEASREAALEAARGEESEASAASKAAAKEVKAFATELKKIARGQSQAAAELELVTGPLADFEALRERTAKVAEDVAADVAEVAPAVAGA